ncbi:MAG TPA: hypothetical protein VGI39_19490, partial [Polyangiaceae bacterium]
GERARFAHGDSLEAAVDLLTAAERFGATGIYVVANRIDDAVATRREPRKWHDALKGQSTTDRDIAARRVILIDIDAKRPSGTSATDDEVGATIPVAAAIHVDLVRAFGPRSIAAGDSGNGRQIYLALEATKESDAVSATVRELLAALARRFDTDRAQIDVTVSDPKRLVPAFGTFKRKGAAGIAHRPHRPTAFVCADAIPRLSIARIAGFTAPLAPTPPESPPPRPTPSSSPTLRSGVPRPFERANAVAIEDVARWLSLLDDGAPRCPGCGHTRGVAFVGNGLKCLHQSCAHRGPRRAPGFRTPVDLVAEVRQLSPREAVNALATHFHFDGFAEPPAPAPASARVRILLGTDERHIADLAIGALAAGAPHLYQRSGALVHVVEDDERHRIVPLAHATLREHLADRVEWVESRVRKSEAVTVSAHPPRWCVEAILARGQWEGVRPLRAVVEFPVLRPDGTVLSEPGYDAATKLLYRPNARFDAIAESPTLADAERARDLLLDVFHDFPFRADSNRSACLAALLTPFARHAFVGAVPSALVDGNAPGAGKGLIANVLGTIVTGRELDARAEVDHEEELRKRIMSIARTGAPLVLIDNVTKPLGGGALDAALTARSSWSDRGLGTFDEVRTPMVALWIFTGNNIEFRRKDTKRRCLHIRLESDEANPENRRGFRHHPLLPYVHAQRPALVAAALTILRGYVAAGRPLADLPIWGSFEEWSLLVRQALVWCGLPDPYEARVGLDEVDTETTSLGALLDGWQEIARDLAGARQSCTASEALEALRQDDLARATPELRRHPARYARLRQALAELLPTPPGQLPSAHRLGALLRRFRGRVLAGKKLTCSTYAGSNVWNVMPVGADVSPRAGPTAAPEVHPTS